MKIRIGSRGSALALWQAGHVRDRLAALGHDMSLQVITTTGDRLQDKRLEVVGGKGAFLKEIEEAMLAGEIDLAVHSLKDVPTALPDGLGLVAVLERADPRDAWISASGATLDSLPAGARVGTTSLRRRAQILERRRDLAVEDLRGNVDTRLRRLRDGAYEAIVLAMAGLVRLGRAGEVTRPLDAREFLPAPGQGVIGLECRLRDESVAAAVAPLHHAPTHQAVVAERGFLAALGGGCNVPLGAHAAGEDGALRLRAFVSDPEGRRLLRAESAGADPADLGRAVAADLLGRGAAALLGR
jgi:hydroxymethylbilane synthase